MAATAMDVIGVKKSADPPPLHVRDLHTCWRVGKWMAIDIHKAGESV